MDSSQILGTTTFMYLTATFCYLAFAFFRVKGLGVAGTFFTALAILFNAAGLAVRWRETYTNGIGHVPLSNMYESLVFFALSIAIIYLAVEYIYKNRVVGSFILPFAFFAMAYASYSQEFGREIKPLLPALQSNWLVAHVVTCFIGYAAFAISCGLAIFYFVKSWKTTRPAIDSQPPTEEELSLKAIDTISHKMMVFGFLWLSAGIITGAVWANSAWGTYWSWDPKETWSLITWFIYAFALHARMTRQWAGRRMAWMSLIGFISVIFTYYGVNFLLSGLHSYGG